MRKCNNCELDILATPPPWARGAVYPKDNTVNRLNIRVRLCSHHLSFHLTFHNLHEIGLFS